MKVSWMGWDERQFDGIGWKSVGWDGMKVSWMGSDESQFDGMG